MAGSALAIHDVPIATLASFMEACAAHPHADGDRIAEFAGFSPSTARRALPSLVSLGVVGRDDARTYTCHADGVRRGMPSEQKELVIRRALQDYRPFGAMCEGLAIGESEADAVRKAALLLGIDSVDLPKFHTLIKWGVELGILERSEAGQLVLASEVAESVAAEFEAISAADVASEMAARLYVAQRLGRAINNTLDEHDRRLLAEALLVHRVDPGDSVEKSGQAVENVLRSIANAKGLIAEAAKLNGAGQLASLLASKALIHSHHIKLVEAVATVRNAKAHHKDKKTMSPWTITELGAFSTMIGALVALRSIYEYIDKGGQTI